MDKVAHSNQDINPAGAGCRSGCLWMLAAGALVIALISLALNGVLLAALLQRQAFARAAIDQALAALDEAATSSVTLNFPVSQTIDFEGSIPIQQDFIVPFESTIPINTIVSVPIDLGPLGTSTIDIPVNTSLPVNLQVPVHIDQSFPIKTSVPLRMTVPIRLSPAEPPLRDWLQAVREFLILLRQQI
ncbi:MAG: hypothetical protein JW850_09430 [Thermoflexales bacterium]|nr:hypothetical protein [Thermoflexales bacterium]